jgi:hypothetical protein
MLKLIQCADVVVFTGPIDCHCAARRYRPANAAGGGQWHLAVDQVCADSHTQISSKEFDRVVVNGRNVRWQRLKQILPIAVMLIACVGCGGGTSTSSGSSPAPAAPNPPPSGSIPPMSSNNINDNDPAIIYSKGNGSTQNWHYFQSSKEDFQQDEHSNDFVRSGGAIQGTGVVLNFNGTGITWIGKKGPQYGIASYSVDGGPPKTVDNYNSTEIGQNSLLIVSGLSAD